MTIKQMSQRSGISYSVIQERIKIYLNIHRLKRNYDYPNQIYEVIKNKDNFKNKYFVGENK